MQLPLMCPLLGAWPATQACALTGNETDDPLFPRSVLNPLSHTSQGSCCGFKKKNYSFIFRERGREGDREGEKHRCERNIHQGCLLYPDLQGPNTQPSPAPWLGMEPVTFCFAEDAQPNEPFLSELIVLLICISLVPNDSEHLFMCLLSFGCLM